ncbi:MAG: alanine racemase [Pseudomonadota bacterium]|nr:alanine racemase [Pseudomonadota bacterium]
MRPIQARIDLAALHDNLQVAQKLAPQSKIMAVLKANAYGHGLLRAASAMKKAAGFAVLNIEDAMALREAGFDQTILLLEGFFDREELRLVHEYHLATVVHQQEQLRLLLQAAPGKLDVHLKINTGMNRLGFKPDDFPSAMSALRQARLSSLTLMTHFATADEPAGVREQLTLFREITAGLSYPRSLANSAALIRFRETHADWVRPGIMLYGASPFAERSAAGIGVKPAMTLNSEIIAIQKLESGHTVGYGSGFRAEHSMRVGIVACGYADGYPRHAPTGTPVLVEGERVTTAGRVSMDMICVDLGKVPQARIGSPVELWGAGLSVDEVARSAGTVGYELLCGLASRVPITER